MALPPQMLSALDEDFVAPGNDSSAFSCSAFRGDSPALGSSRTLGAETQGQRSVRERRELRALSAETRVTLR